jgi:capsular polysaccharide biosynthesis protein
MLLRRRESTAIGVERALYIGSRAPYNWYHWLINLLPALHIANLAGVDERVPLLLPSRVKQTVQMLESLEVFRRGREVLWIPDDAVVQVQDLYWPESPVFDSPFSIARSSRRPLALHPEAMESFRDELLEHFRHLPAPARSERVYLARRPRSSRPFNGEEVETWAIELGFRVVFVEELSFSDQVALFRGAEFVIGPTGAAFTNMLFASAKARGLRFVGKAEPFENYFSNLSTVCGARILDVVGTPSNLKGGDEGFTLSREAFLRAVEVLLDSK